MSEKNKKIHMTMPLKCFFDDLVNNRSDVVEAIFYRQRDEVASKKFNKKLWNMVVDVKLKNKTTLIITVVTPVPYNMFSKYIELANDLLNAKHTDYVAYDQE